MSEISTAVWEDLENQMCSFHLWEERNKMSAEGKQRVCAWAFRRHVSKTTAPREEAVCV